MDLSNTRKVVFQGWLWKCPRMMKMLANKWSRRWFVLEVAEGRTEFIVLKQYSTKDMNYCNSILGMNLCEELRTGTDLKYKKRRYPNTFGVKVLYEWRYFAADSEKEMNDWVIAINTACGLRKYDSEKSSTSLSSRWRDKFRNAFFSTTNLSTVPMGTKYNESGNQCFEESSSLSISNNQSDSILSTEPRDPINNSSSGSNISLNTAVQTIIDSETIK